MSDGYKVGLVGERNYQPAIERCTVGEVAFIRHEPDNPYDAKALVAVDARGATIGYVPRDHWLQRAVHKEAKSCSARVAAIGEGGSGLLGVVLTVAMQDGAMAQVSHRRDHQGLAIRTTGEATAPPMDRNQRQTLIVVVAVVVLFGAWLLFS